MRSRGSGPSRRTRSRRTALAATIRTELLQVRLLGARERGPRISSSASRPSATASSRPRSIVVYPFHGVIRPSATRRSRSGAGPGAAGTSNCRVSIAWPIPRTLGLSSGNERRSTLSTTSAARVASRNERSAFQCVYHNATGIRYGLQSGAARSRKSGIMCESSASGRVRRWMTSAPRMRSKAAPRPILRAGPERSQGDVIRQGMSAGVIAEHGDVLAPPGERVDHVDRLRERRMVRVDDLGCEDEPHEATSARARPSRRRARASGGRTAPASSASRRSARGRRRRGVRRAACRRAHERAPRRAHPSSSRGTRTPSTPSWTRSSTPPAAVATTARPRANASITTLPEALGPGGKHQKGRVVEGCGDFARRQLRVVLDLIRVIAEQRGHDTLAGAFPDDHEPRARQLRRHTAPGRAEPVDVLVRLEHAHEERHRRAGKRRDRALGERREVAVRRERRGRRLTTHLLDEAGGESRESARGVGAANRPAGDASAGSESTRRPSEP